MAKTETKGLQKSTSKPKKSDSLIDFVDKMKPESTQAILRIFEKEAEEVKLDFARRNFLKEELHLKDVDMNNWQTAADVIRHFDTSDLWLKYPEDMKSTLVDVLESIPLPPTAIAGRICSMIPDDILSKLVGYSLKATPEHLVNMIVSHRANVVATRNAAYAEGDRIEEGKRNLAFVTKDELLYEQLKKLVETDDDEDEEILIGTKDGTVRMIRWEEQKWVYRKKTDTVDTKVIVIGDCKGADSGVKLMDVKFDQYGVRYGWIGNCAYVQADLRRIRAKGAYDAMLAELGELPVPDVIKEDKKLRLNWKTGLKTALATPLMAKDLYDDTVAVKRQMYFYGVIRFYYHHLEEFLES